MHTSPNRSPRRQRRSRWQRWRGLCIPLLVLLGIGIFLGTTDNQRIWPYRNTLQYHVLHEIKQWWPTTATGTGALHGVVRDMAGKPIVGARVLVAQEDGTPWSSVSDDNGAYSISPVPAGRYVPIAGASGYADKAIRRAGLLRIPIPANRQTNIDITLDRLRPDVISPLTDWSLGQVQNVSIPAPLPATAHVRQVHYQVNGQANQTTLYYTPDGGAPVLPTILAVYPGPADTWAQVSIPLAQAGFAVIAVGPAYALDLEPDVDDLQRLIDQLQSGAFPRADPQRIGIIAGSYSSLHVFRLAERQVQGIGAMLLLGPPTDLFELRRQFEAGTFFPPFGLDNALIALGFPDRDPERYWRYSVRYHASSINVPIMLIHSKIDEVVPFTQSQLLADELQRLGKPYELHILEGMGHYLLEPKRTPAIDDLFKTTIGFFTHELQASR